MNQTVGMFQKSPVLQNSRSSSVALPDGIVEGLPRFFLENGAIPQNGRND
jgi:hypothetical protein